MADLPSSTTAGFETSDSIQHEKLFGEVARARASGRHRLIVVEGFRAFHDPRLVELMDVLIWLELGGAAGSKCCLPCSTTPPDAPAQCS